MKPHRLNIIIISGLFLFSSAIVAQGLSYKTLNSCKKDYAEMLELKDENVTSVSEFPPGIYLARSVVQSLKKSDEQYISYQSMLKNSKSSQDVCYTGEAKSAIKTQAFIPTLIDRSEAQKFGHTYWSFSAVLDKLTGAVQSKRSLIPNKNYKEALETQGYKVVSTQKNHDEFTIHLERNVSSWKETIVITYDQF